MAKKYKIADKQLRVLRKRRDRIRVKEGITEAQRAEQLGEIQLRMNDKYNGVNRRWNALIEKD